MPQVLFRTTGITREQPCKEQQLPRPLCQLVRSNLATIENTSRTKPAHKWPNWRGNDPGKIFDLVESGRLPWGEIRLAAETAVAVMADSDPAGTLAWIYALPHHQKKDLLHIWTDAVVAHDPKLAADLMTRSRAQSYYTLGRLSFAISEWAKRDLDAALEFSCQARNQFHWMEGYRGIAMSIMDRPLEEQIEILNSFAGPRAQYAKRQLVQLHLDRGELEHGRLLVEHLSEALNPIGQRHLMFEFASAADPETAYAWARNFFGPEHLDLLRANFIKRRSFSPERNLELAAETTSWNERRQQIEAIVPRLRGDAEELTESILDLPDVTSRRLGLQVAAASKPAEMFKYALSLSNGPDRNLIWDGIWHGFSRRLRITAEEMRNHPEILNLAEIFAAADGESQDAFRQMATRRQGDGSSLWMEAVVGE